MAKCKPLYMAESLGQLNGLVSNKDKLKGALPKR